MSGEKVMYAASFVEEPFTAAEVASVLGADRPTESECRAVLNGLVYEGLIQRERETYGEPFEYVLIEPEKVIDQNAVVKEAADE